jgi:hypothetical protein
VAAVSTTNSKVTTTQVVQNESAPPTIEFTPMEPLTQEQAALASATIESGTQETPSGFSKMQSDSFHFSMQYPKSWYYSGSTSSEAGVTRHYEFGSKPLEESPGPVSLDLMSGPIPSGTPTAINKIQIVKQVSGDSVIFYAKASGSRLYKITGPASSESTLLQMASSIEELP